MNDFIAKPIDPEILFNTLHKWLTHYSESTANAMSSQNLSTKWTAAVNWPIIAGIDSASAAHVLGGDKQLFDEVLQFFVEDNPEIMDQINSYFAQNRLINAANVIHKLKGQAAYIGAQELTEACSALEMDALKEQSDEINEKWNAIELQNRRLLTAIKAYLIGCVD
jgi:HPt (histidine-containing phosphotransfer) domain-containing protein